MKRVLALVSCLFLTACWSSVGEFLLIDCLGGGCNLTFGAAEAAIAVGDAVTAKSGPPVDPEYDPIPGAVWMTAADLNDMGIRYASSSTGRAKQLWKLAVGKGSEEAAINLSEAEKGSPQYRMAQR